MVVATKFSVKHQGKVYHHPPSTIHKLPFSDLPGSTPCPSLSLSFTTLSCSSQSPFAGWVVLSTPCLLGLKLPHQLYPSHYFINCFPAGFIPVICLIYLNTRYCNVPCIYFMFMNIDTRIYMAMKTLRSHLNNNMKKCNLEIKGDLQTFNLLDHNKRGNKFQ